MHSVSRAVAALKTQVREGDDELGLQPEEAGESLIEVRACLCVCGMRVCAVLTRDSIMC